MKGISSTGSPMDFARAIEPMSPETFFAEFFEKKHLVIRREDRGYYSGLLSLNDIDDVLTRQILPMDDLNMVNNGKAIPTEEYTVQAGHVDPVRVAQHFSEGATVILPGLQRRIPQLAAFCRSLETVFSCDLQTNIYLTPDNAQGFKPHYDSHDVIVLQAHGTKTWRIYESTLDLPLRTQAFSPDGFVAGKLIDEFVLRAGDMAYVPRGVVHDAIATDEVSLHVTTGLLATRWVDLMMDAIADLAHKDLALRHAVTPGIANDDARRDDLRRTFRDLLMHAAASIDPDATLDAFAAEFRRRRVPLVPGQFLQRLDLDAIEPGTEVARRPDLIYALSTRDGEDGEEVVLSVYDTEIIFPAIAEATLRDALERPAFVVGELGGEIDEPGQAVLARRLVREGVLARTGARDGNTGR
jgi:ribosomal protein L16 Arg81 hydroxylase